MKQVLKLIIFVTICINLVWSVYVPEPTSKENHLPIRGAYYKAELNENKSLLQRDLHESDNKLNNNDDNDGVDGHVAEHNNGQQQSLYNNAQQANTLNAKQQQQQQQLLPILTKQKSYDIVEYVAVDSAKTRTNIHKHENLEAQPTTGLPAEQQQQHNDVLFSFDKVEEIDAANDTDKTLTKHSRQKRQLSDFLIAPNTRWCGRGNTANGTYNHLGGASMADKCCRTHDHCQRYIPAMSNRYDLFNYRPYTLSHCNCDRRFRTCLKMANDEDANTIGKLFFNLVQTQCFILTKEVVCQQRSTNGECLQERIKQKAYLRNNKKY